ncbi:MAG: branched-chain amino acid ABC transporter permease [Candidatus Thiodiazotropha endolucinida]
MDWINSLIQGTLLGGQYALYAAGLSLMFGVMRLVNIAHGDFIVLAAFIALVAVDTMGIHPLISALIVVPAMFVIGYVLQRGVLNATLKGDILPPLLVTFGLSIILQNFLLELFSADSQRLQVGALQGANIHITEDLSIGWMPLMVFVAAIAVIGGLQVLFYRTTVGMAFRATSDKQHIVPLMGIDNRHIFGLAMGIAMAVVGIAAVFMSIRTNFNPTVGPARLLYAFEAVIIGGLGNLWGTLAGGIIIGVAQSIGAKIDPGWQLLSGHLAFLVALLLRPNGLFPRTKD